MNATLPLAASDMSTLWLISFFVSLVVGVIGTLMYLVFRRKDAGDENIDQLGRPSFWGALMMSMGLFLAVTFLLFALTVQSQQVATTDGANPVNEAATQPAEPTTAPAESAAS